MPPHSSLILMLGTKEQIYSIFNRPEESASVGVNEEFTMTLTVLKITFKLYWHSL